MGRDCPGVRLLHRTSRSVTPTTAGVQVLARARQLLAEVDNLVREATTGHTRLRIGHAWSALGRHTLEFQRRWAARYPEVELQLIRTNSSTGGLAEGLCDLAVVRTPPDDDPWARRRSLRLEEVGRRTVALDRRTGSTSPDLWPPASEPAVEYTRDIDDWLAVIATGRCVGITPESTVTQYRRQGIAFRPLRDAAPVPVWLIWHRQDPHPATHAAVALAADLYRAAAPRERPG